MEIKSKLALTLTLSPREREQPSGALFFTDNHPANPVAGHFSLDGR
jgi:hypothetical protein